MRTTRTRRCAFPVLFLEVLAGRSASTTKLNCRKVHIRCTYSTEVARSRSQSYTGSSVDEGKLTMLWDGSGSVCVKCFYHYYAGRSGGVVGQTNV